MKIVNTANNKVLANIITNHRMSIEEALELVGYDLSQCDDDGAYIDDDGEQFWIEDCCEEADEDKGESENMKTKTLYALKRNSIWLPRRNHGKDYKAYAPLISLEAQDDCEPVELQRGESLEELKAVLNSDACAPTSTTRAAVTSSTLSTTWKKRNTPATMKKNGSFPPAQITMSVKQITRR